jgi:type III restriction enzyme
MNAEQLYDFLMREHSYAEALRKKIRSLADVYAEKKFKELLNAKQTRMQNDYSLLSAIVPGKTGTDIANSLYEKALFYRKLTELGINGPLSLPIRFEARGF